MTVDEKIRNAASETRSAFSGRPHPPITRIGNRAAVRRFVAVAAGALLVFATIGVAGWVAVGGSADVAETADTPPPTPAPSQPSVTEPTDNTIPPTTTPDSAVPADDGLSDTSAIPEGWRSDFPEDGEFLLLDSGIAFAAFPQPESEENDWWVSIARAEHFDGSHTFGPDDQAVNVDQIPEVFVLLAFGDETSEVVVAGFAPADASTVEITFGKTPVTIDRVFQRTEVGRSVFVGSFPAELILDQESPLPIDISATDADGQEIPLPSVEYQGSSVNDQYTGPITSDLFRIPPPLITGSTTSGSRPEVVACQGGPGVDDVPPNQGREIANGEVLSTPRAVLEALLGGELSDSWYPHGGFIEMAMDDGTIAYAVPFNDDLASGAVVLIEVAPVADGWTVTSWETSGC